MYNILSPGDGILLKTNIVVCTILSIFKNETKAFPDCAGFAVSCGLHCPWVCAIQFDLRSVIFLWTTAYAARALGALRHHWRRPRSSGRLRQDSVCRCSSRCSCGQYSLDCAYQLEAKDYPIVALSGTVLLHSGAIGAASTTAIWASVDVWQTSFTFENDS
jgi:hypothetical protein